MDGELALTERVATAGAIIETEPGFIVTHASAFPAKRV